MSRELRDLRTTPPLAELDAEREVDLRRYGAAVASRWWLLLVGLLVGIGIGYLVAVAAGSSFRARTLVSLGEPLAPGGGGRVGSILTNSATIREIVDAESVLRRVSAKTGIPVRELRGHVTVGPALTAAGRVANLPLINIEVEGARSARVAAAANEFSVIVIDRVDGYVEAKLANLRRQIAIADAEIESLTRRLDAASRASTDESLSDLERLVIVTNAGLLETRRAGVQGTKSQYEQLVALAREVEQPRVVETASPRKIVGQNRRNAVVAGGVIGLILGLAVALAWNPLAGRLAGAPARA
jgi:uncharacterized protein involved in exopolysaccharide biosynthesis